MLKIINQEIEDFKTKHINIVPGLMFNQYKTIDQIHFYNNSTFKSGMVDDEGDRKYFRNISKNPSKVFTKAVDFDTKNIRLLTEAGGDSLKTWFMERDLKYWMKEQQFGKTLNRLFAELPIYGTVVLKIVDGEPHFVDLRNFVVEQSAESLKDMSHITEIHNLTPAKFRKVGKQMGWKKADINEAIEKFNEMKGISRLRLYERYGDVPDEKDSGEIDYTYKRVFYADVGVDEFDNHGELQAQHAGVEMSSEEWEDNPYWEFHADKVPGRWLGLGVVESLFEPQIAVNESTNLQAKSAFWAALRVFQTRDPGVNRNLSTDVRNGDIMNVDSEITQIDMSDRNLAFFNQHDQKWMSNRDELTFSYDVVQGERLPAGTPLGSAKLAVSQTLTYFETIQENIALDIKEMLYEVIIPSFQKDRHSKHTLRLVGKDLDTYIGVVKNDLVNKEVIRLALLPGQPFPDNETSAVVSVAIEEAIKQGKEKILDVPKGYYDNVKYDIDIDITGESVDTKVRYATRFAILQAITADPTMTTDPVKKKMLYGMAEDGGINPNDLFDTATPQQNIMEQQVAGGGGAGGAGGGVSAPQLGGEALPGQNTQTL